MIDNWFTNKCMTLIGSNGRALSGGELADAEAALMQAKSAGLKIWTDRNGNFFCKAKALFAPARPITDCNGKPVRICGKMVKCKAKFCSKCGADAPGSWWRCGGCGKLIGNESLSCPHCGRPQNPPLRHDIVSGCWQKDEDIFAERFELFDVETLLAKGLNIQESQCAILLDGGAVCDLLTAGFYPPTELDKNSGCEKTVIMVDNSEFSLPICVESLFTADDIPADLHLAAVLRFDADNAAEFMRNLMGSSVYLKNDTITSSLGYDAVAHALLADIDAAAREFCRTRDLSALFKDADVRIALEDHIAAVLQRNLAAYGLRFVRLKEVEFQSEAFDKLRSMSGDLEFKRREIEFIRRADELANDATRRQAMSEYEMEEFMNQLAHEKGIKDDLRIMEIGRMRKEWARTQEKESLLHQQDVDDLQQMHRHDQVRAEAGLQQELTDLEHRKKLERQIAEHQASLEYAKVESLIEDIKIETAKKKADIEVEMTQKYLDQKLQKQTFAHNQKLEMLKAAEGASIQAMLMAEDDPEKRRQLLELHEQQMQSKMTPELLLAAAAARGNAAAAEALSKMNKEQLAAIEREKNNNRDVFESMLKMNERMFDQATEQLSRKQEAPVVPPTTQIIK